MTDVFNLDDVDGMRSFFDTNGYVVVKVFDNDECTSLVKEIGEMMKEKNEKFDLSDPSTYDHAPVPRTFPVMGRKPMFDKCMLRMRCHPNVHRAFEIIYGRSDLLSNHDRIGFYRPTITPTGEETRWISSYKYPSIHLDFNPSIYHSDIVKIARDSLSYNNVKDFLSENNMYAANMGDDHHPHLQLQGVLNLLDNREGDGGFQCVPGFHKKFEEWRVNLPDQGVGTNYRYEFSEDDENDMSYLDIKRIACPAGSLIVWDQRLAHGRCLGHSVRCRLVHYMRLFPSTYLSDDVRERRRKKVREMISNVDTSDLDLKVLDL